MNDISHGGHVWRHCHCHVVWHYVTLAWLSLSLVVVLFDIMLLLYLCCLYSGNVAPWTIRVGTFIRNLFGTETNQEHLVMCKLCLKLCIKTAMGDMTQHWTYYFLLLFLIFFQRYYVHHTCRLNIHRHTTKLDDRTFQWLDTVYS